MIDPHPSCRFESYDAADDRPTNPSTEPTIGDIVNVRYNRRAVLKGMLGASAMGALAASPLALLAAADVKSEAQPPAGALPADPAAIPSRFGFDEIARGVDGTHHVAPGYTAEVLIRWGDPVLPGAPAFDPYAQSAAAQSKQFGYNNDFIGYIPLPPPVRRARGPLRLGPFPPALRHQRGAQRAQPLRLDRRGRPLRSGRTAGQAYGPGPLQARGGGVHRQRRRPPGALLRGRPALRVCLPIRFGRAGQPERPRRQSRPAGPRHPLGGALRQRRDLDLVAAGLRRERIDPRERIP